MSVTAAINITSFPPLITTISTTTITNNILYSYGI